MSIERCTVDTNVISELPDAPAISASELKGKFDTGESGIKEYINNTLIPDIESAITTESTSIRAVIENKNITYVNRFNADEATIGEHTTSISDINSSINTINTTLAGKANSNNVYTKAEVDTKVGAKANSSDVYTKSEVNTKLGAKANSSDVYTKAQVDTKVNAKANSSDVYTKTTTDSTFLKKTDAGTTYQTKARYGTSDPASSLGANGDIYFKYI
jgi:hypothetical protein